MAIPRWCDTCGHTYLLAWTRALPPAFSIGLAYGACLTLALHLPQTCLTTYHILCAFLHHKMCPEHTYHICASLCGQSARKDVCTYWGGQTGKRVPPA